MRGKCFALLRLHQLKPENHCNPIAHHMSRDLLHLGRWSSGSRVELVDEEAWEAVLSNQLHRLLEVLVRLSGKATDDVGGNGDAWNPARNRTTGNRYNERYRNNDTRCKVKRSV